MTSLQNISFNYDTNVHVQVPIVNNKIREWCEIVTNLMMLFFNGMGVVTNILNFVVFREQGLTSDGIAIALFSLALADFLSCFVMLPNNACFALALGVHPVTFRNCFMITVVPFRHSHFVCSRIICWITVYISVERSLCVLWPFKVKTLFTPKVTTASMCGIYTFFITFYVPRGVSNKLVWRFDPVLNATVAFNYENELGRTLVYYQSLVGTVLFSFTAMIIITVATGMMLFKLNTSKKWRQKAGKGNAAAATDGQSRKDAEVMKTVTAVSGSFLVCLLMDQIPGFAILTLPGVSVTGFNRNLFNVLYTFRCLLDSVTSSINFFIYMTISTRFRTAFQRAFPGKAKT